MLLLCVCERVIFHDCKLVHVCTRTRILLGQAQVDGLAGARALLHTHLRCAKCNLVSFVAITIAHMPMPAYVCVHLSRMCAYFQFSWSSVYFVDATAAAAAALFFIFFSDSTIRLWVPTNQVHGDGKAHENTVSLQLKMPSIAFFSCSLAPSRSALRFALRFDTSFSFGTDFFECSWVSLSHRAFQQIDIFHLFLCILVKSFDLSLSHSIALCVFIACVCLCQPHSSKINMSKRICISTIWYGSVWD